MSPLIAGATNYQDVLILSSILGTAIAVTVCAGIVFMTGVSQQKVTLGVLGAVVAIGAASLLTFQYYLPITIGLAILIPLIPKFGSRLISESEVEAEMRRARMM